VGDSNLCTSRGSELKPNPSVASASRFGVMAVTALLHRFFSLRIAADLAYVAPEELALEEVGT
jgi:hypothetical protein